MASKTPKKPKRKPDNPFQRLQKTVDQILKIAPAVDEDLNQRLRRLEKDMRRRHSPRPIPKRKEFNI